MESSWLYVKMIDWDLWNIERKETECIYLDQGSPPKGVKSLL